MGGWCGTGRPVPQPGPKQAAIAASCLLWQQCLTPAHLRVPGQVAPARVRTDALPITGLRTTTAPWCIHSQRGEGSKRPLVHHVSLEHQRGHHPPQPMAMSRKVRLKAAPPPPGVPHPLLNSPPSALRKSPANSTFEVPASDPVRQTHHFPMLRCRSAAELLVGDRRCPVRCSVSLVLLLLPLVVVGLLAASPDGGGDRNPGADVCRGIRMRSWPEGLLFAQCARSTEFCVSGTNPTLVLGLFHNTRAVVIPPVGALCFVLCAGSGRRQRGYKRVWGLRADGDPGVGARTMEFRAFLGYFGGYA